MSANKTEELSLTNAATHSIKLHTKDHIVRNKQRKIPVSKKAEVKKLLDEMEAAGIISKSSSEWATCPRLVEKEDKSITTSID